MWMAVYLLIIKVTCRITVVPVSTQNIKNDKFKQPVLQQPVLLSLSPNRSVPKNSSQWLVFFYLYHY